MLLLNSNITEKQYLGTLDYLYKVKKTKLYIEPRRNTEPNVYLASVASVKIMTQDRSWFFVYNENGFALAH